MSCGLSDGGLFRSLRTCSTEILDGGMTERKIKLKPDSFELRLLINALVEWRNRLLAENAPTEDVGALLLELLKMLK